LNLWHGKQAGALVVALVCVVWFSAPVKGRQAPGAPFGSAQGKPANQVESDPIRCWWKTDTNAVRVGEPFTLALTCGVIETDAVRVVEMRDGEKDRLFEFAQAFAAHAITTAKQ